MLNDWRSSWITEGDVVMNQQQLVNLKQLAATLRLSTHILERYPEQLYNQIAGRLGEVAYLQNMSLGAQPYLRQISRSLKKPDQTIVRMLVGHSDTVKSCVFSPDGKLVVSASTDMTLRLWDVETGDCLRVFRGHTQLVTACAFIPDGRQYIVSASEDATLRLWDCNTGETLRVLSGHTQTINACAFSPDGRYILSGSGGNEWQQLRDSTDNSLRLWDVETGQCEHIFEFPEEVQDRICACVFSEDGRLALSVGADGRLHLWNMETRQCIRTCREYSELLSCLFIPDTSQSLHPSFPGNALSTIK
jgi:WD40 repeat protein